MKIKQLIGLVITVCLLNQPVSAGEDSKRIVIPDDLFYYQPAATTFGVNAAWNNPARLSRYGAAGFVVMADYVNGNYARSWGTAIYRDRLTTAFRHIDNPDGQDYDELVTALGMKAGPALNFGISYRYFREGPGLYNNRHFWNIGLSHQGAGPFAMGALFSNLNRGKINGEQSATEQRYSLGYRPIGRKLTLAVDMFFSTQNKPSEADFVYHARYLPIRGLYLTASIDSDRNYQLGLRANLLKYFVGSESSFDRNGHGGHTTAYFGATNMRQPSLIGERRRNLTVRVTGRISENPPQPRFGRRSLPFITLITSLYRAADDESIASMRLDLSRLALGFGQAQELREALLYFKSRGKRIICHLSLPNNIGYLVASAADTILIPPVSQLRLVGLRAELTFWAGTLDKLGINMELLRVGEYKSGPETYTRQSATPENRAQLDRLLDDLYDQFVETIASGRQLSADSVRRIIDNGPFTSTEAVQYGLVDGLSYRDKVGSDYFAGLPEVSFRRYQADTLINDDWRPRPLIAIVVAEGEITGNGGGSDPFGRQTGVRPAAMARAFERAHRNPNVKALVFRVNSPGGWAMAGEQIHRSAYKASEAKPMVVSMGNVAASGGYYIAMPSERIFVNPATITGSIGIYGGKADFSGLYDKLAVGKELFTRGRYAGMLTNIRPFTDDERQKYQDHLQEFYSHFVNLVADSRKLPVDSIDQLSRGQVWTGREALENGLADAPGGLKQALDYAAAELGLDDYDIVIYPQNRPWFIMPGQSLFRSVLSILTGNENSLESGVPSVPTSEEESIMARMPYDLTIE